MEAVKTAVDLMRQFEFRKPRKIFHSIMIHFEDESAVPLEEQFVNSQLVPTYDEQDYNKQTTYDYLINVTPVTELEHVIFAVPADATTVAYHRIPLARLASCVTAGRGAETLCNGRVS